MCIRDSLSYLPQNLSFRINDFWITYTKQTTITQFYSDLSILNLDGNEIERKTIFVNSPAKYNGVDYYQTDWNIIGLRIKNKDSSIFQYPFINLPDSKEKFWLTWISTNPQLNEGLTIKSTQAITIVVTIIVVSIMFWFLNKTKTGTSMRAYSDNEDLALLSGIDPKRVVLITWVIAGILATIGGVLYGLDKSYRPFVYFS